MTVLTHSVPLAITTGSGSTLRTWEGVLAFERDDETQVVTLTWTAARVSGTSTGSQYFPTGGLTIPADFRPETEVYPGEGYTSITLRPDGTFDVYSGGPEPIAFVYRYVTGAAIVEPAPPAPLPSTEFLGIFGDWAIDTVQVRPYEGEGSSGAVLGLLRPVEGVLVRWGDRLVRSSAENQRLSDVQIAATLESRDLWAPGTEVTLPTGEVRTVIARLVDEHVLPHVEAVLV